MDIIKKIFFSETTGCRKLKLGMYVPTYEDTLICSRRSDPISNMVAVTYISKILLVSICQLFMKGFCLNLTYAHGKAFLKTY